MPNRLIDLSHEITDGMTTYPGLPGPAIGPWRSFDESHGHYAPGVEFQIDRIEMVGNTGTYLDAPAHRYRDGFDQAGLPLESVANLPGLVVDIDGRAARPEVFENLDVRGCAVLVRTGWDGRWGTEEYGAADHPHITGEAADLLVEAGAALVGIDSVNIDDTAPGAPATRPVHSALLAAGIPVVEHLCNLDQLGDAAFRFFAVPVKARGMGTLPVRAFALLE